MQQNFIIHGLQENVDVMDFMKWLNLRTRSRITNKKTNLQA